MAWRTPTRNGPVFWVGAAPTGRGRGPGSGAAGRVPACPGAVASQAGKRASKDGAVETAGGRVLTVTATGSTLDEAAERAYRACDRIRFEGKQLRRDIGWQARRA